MRLEDTDTEESDFDFEAWAASAPKPTFEGCAKAALRSLALSNDDLRIRLRGALFCLFYADPKTVPAACQPMYDEVAQYVRERLQDGHGFSELGRFTKKIKLKSARRLSRKIFAIYEKAVERRAK